MKIYAQEIALGTLRPTRTLFVLSDAKLVREIMSLEDLRTLQSAEEIHFFGSSFGELHDDLDWTFIELKLQGPFTGLLSNEKDLELTINETLIGHEMPELGILYSTNYCDLVRRLVTLASARI